MLLCSNARRLDQPATVALNLKRLMAVLLLGPVACFPAGAFAEAPRSVAQATPGDGSHDFDFEIGAWSTHLRRLRHPLSGSNEWVEYDGTTVVRSLLGGRANLVELVLHGSAGRIEGVSLRLYEPESHQWTLNFANIRDGHLTAPVIGEFHDGVGRFYALDSLNGRSILVRFIISKVSKDSWRFEQSFSSDGGQTWEVNWIATDTRLRQ